MTVRYPYATLSGVNRKEENCYERIHAGRYYKNQPVSEAAICHCQQECFHQGNRDISCPVHIKICGKNGTSGVVICEQMKAIDPRARVCSRVDALTYPDIMNVSDTIQGIFEYD